MSLGKEGCADRGAIDLLVANEHNGPREGRYRPGPRALQTARSGSGLCAGSMLVVPRSRTAAARPFLLQPNGATLSHMEIGVRDLRNRTGQVIDAVQAGERVTLTVHGEPVADIVPHGRRARWLAGTNLRAQLRDRAADPDLTGDLNDLTGQTVDEL